MNVVSYAQIAFKKRIYQSRPANVYEESERAYTAHVTDLDQPWQNIIYTSFLPLLSSSAGEIHVQSDLNLEINLGNLRLSISLPL